MAALFLFKFRVDLEEYSASTHMAITDEGGLEPKALTGCHRLAGSDRQDGGLPEH